MTKQKYTSLAVKEVVLRAIEQVRITRDIADQFGIGKSRVADVYKRHKERYNNRISLKSGRPRITCERQDILIRAAKNNPRKNSVLLNTKMKEFYNVKCSVDTTKRRLRSANLFGRRPAKKPFISIKNRKARFD